MNEAEKDDQPIIEPDAGEQKESVKIEVTEPMTGESNGEQMIEVEAHEEPETITEFVAEEKTEKPPALMDLEAEAPVEREVFSPAPTPVPAPVPEAPKVEQNSGGVLVLQWLSYAFWFWFGLSICWLSAVVINFYVSGDASDSWGAMLAYPLASVIIMFLIAFITDWFYAKHEPEKKTGAANVIMLLHVVPFVLIAIGGLVSVVFALINMLLNSDPVSSIDGTISVMLVSGITAVLFGALAARAFFGKKKRVRVIAWVFFGLFAAGFIVAGLGGPAAEAMRTKDDRLVEQYLPSLSSDIQNYASDNNKLPASLSDVTHASSYESEAVQKLIDSKLVVYKPNTLPSEDGNTSSPTQSLEDLSVSGAVGGTSGYYAPTEPERFYYQLCTTYKYEKKNEYNYTQDSSEAAYTIGSGVGARSDYRYAYVSSISAHPAGEVCYNLYADGKYNYSPLKELN